MLDGAPSLGELEGVSWYTPQQIEDMRQRLEVQRRINRRVDDLGFKKPGEVLDIEKLLKRVK